MSSWQTLISSLVAGISTMWNYTAPVETRILMTAPICLMAFLWLVSILISGVRND